MAAFEADAVEEIAERDDCRENAAESLQDRQEEADAAGLSLVGALLLDDLDELVLKPLDATLSCLAHQKAEPLPGPRARR